MTDLSVQLAPSHAKGLRLANPVMVASGTFGYGIEYAGLVDIQKLGAIVCKGTTLDPRNGNRQPRLIETPFGILNSIGLQNIGVEALVRNMAPIWANWQVPVIVNIAGETIEEYAQIASRLDGVRGISGIEINISCPNVARGGMEFGTDPRAASKVTRSVRSSTSLPVIVKLSPSASDITKVAVAVSEAGADAITLVNTLRGTVIDIARRGPAFENTYGGLSGPAIKVLALHIVYKVASVVNIPIIGCGGIASATDALEFIMAGATAVQVGTANLSDPRTPFNVLHGIEDFCKKEGIRRIVDMIGIGRR